MIKVIASDIDGTLLDSQHKLSAENIEAIKRARAGGIQFLISTGRKYKDAFIALGNNDLADGYIILSGAQTRDSKGKLMDHIPLSYENIQNVMACTEAYPVMVILNGEEVDYIIGNREKMEESLRVQIKMFFGDSEDETKNLRIFQFIRENTKCIASLKELEQKNIVIYKVFILGYDSALLNKLDEDIQVIPEIVSASSYITNLEITQIKAQKGLVLQEYIEKQGFHKDEVMVIGDSMNDMSMLSMDYGATVAMGNANEELKKAAKYITADCDHNGVAKAIECIMDGTMETLRNPVHK